MLVRIEVRYIYMYVYTNVHLYTITNTFLKKMKCDVGMMIDRDVAEKRYENKVGMSSY